MRLFPTRAALDLAVGGAAVVLAGILLFQPAIMAWGGALIVGLSVARAITLLSVARVRAAGFEMVWRTGGRSVRVLKGQTVELLAEVRNRDTRAVRFGQLRVIASPAVEIEVETSAGEVPAGGRLEVVVKVRGKRVGRHGLFGLALELRGSPGLFEVPLTFSNPYGVEVLPALPAQRRKPAPAGGAFSGARSSRRSGDSTEFSELREHQFGDPLKRVAWKASARRGRLLVRQYEMEEREIVWFLLDAAVELWSGRIGSTPLDLAIDCIGDLGRQHLRAGQDVGLVVLANANVTRLGPGRGVVQERRLLEALAVTPTTLEPDRCSLDERGVAHKVLEHLSALAPAEAQRIAPHEIEAVAGLARRVLGQAPFPEVQVSAASPRESLLRSYLAAFGISVPPRLEPRNALTDVALGEQLLSLTRGRQPGSLVYVVSPFPDQRRLVSLGAALRTARRSRTRVAWLHPAEVPGLEAPRDVMGRMARIAARLRSDTEHRSSERSLRRLGIRASVCGAVDGPTLGDNVLGTKGERAI